MSGARVHYLVAIIFMFFASEERIRNGCKKILKSRQGSTQGRLDTFFTVTGSISSKRKVCTADTAAFEVYFSFAAIFFVVCLFIKAELLGKKYLRFIAIAAPENQIFLDSAATSFVLVLHNSDVHFM